MPSKNNKFFSIFGLTRLSSSLPNMKNLQLIPGFHRQQPIVKADFAYDKELITLIKSQKGVRWSQTLRSWYFQKKEFQLNTFYQALKGKVFIDYSKLISHSSATPVKKTPANKTTVDVKLPQAYKEQLILKRYSQNTIKTYSSCFLKFILFFKNQKIETIRKEEIIQFLLHLIQKEKVCAATQNQYINAIKFYYEKVLKQPKMVFEIERPKRAKKLPEVLTESEMLLILKRTLNIKHKTILSLLYSSGLRVGELINLRIQDIIWDKKFLFVRGGKGSKDRITLLSEYAALLLNKYIQKYKPNYWLIENQSRKPYLMAIITFVLFCT